MNNSSRTKVASNAPTPENPPETLPSQDVQVEKFEDISQEDFDTLIAGLQAAFPENR